MEKNLEQNKKKSVVYNLITQRPPTTHIPFILLVSVTLLQQEKQKDQTAQRYQTWLYVRPAPGAAEHGSHTVAHKLIHLADRNYFAV